MEKSIGSQNGAEISLVPHHLNSSGSVNNEKTQKKREEMVLGTFLGIDYGKSKIGLATADSETRMAFSFDTLANDKDFLENLKGIVLCENVRKIIIGMTKHDMDCESSKEKVRFAENLKKELGLPIEFHEEMFSTKMAQENIKLRGGKNIARLDDQEAARIILQSWLDCQI